MKVLKKLFLFFVINLMYITYVDAKSYISEDFVSLGEAVMFNSEDFEIYLELKSLSYSTSSELGMLSGYAKRTKESMYYYHYIFYFYDSSYKEIGSVDGYNGMWHKTSTSGTGTFLGQPISSNLIYDNYSLNQVKYYKLFIEPAKKKTADNFLYKNIKINENGLDPIIDKKTVNMKYSIIKNNNVTEKPNASIGGSSNTDEPIVSNYSLEINVTKDKIFNVREFIRVSNKKQGGAISKTIYKDNGILPEKIIKIDNFFNEGLVSEKSYASFNQVIINEESTSFGYDLYFEEDKNGKEDLIRYTISGDIDIPVEKASFKINLPDEFDISTMKLINAKGKDINKNNYTYKINENTIVINYLVKFYPNDKIIFELSLPNNYFDNSSSNNILIIIVLLFSVVVAGASTLILFLLNKKKKEEIVCLN